MHVQSKHASANAAVMYELHLRTSAPGCSEWVAIALVKP
jgi:hypothetical protein